MDMHPENAWVAARLAALTPTWNPNPARARAAIDQCDRAAEACPRVSARGGSRGRRCSPPCCSRRPAARSRRSSGTASSCPVSQVVRLDLSRVPLDTQHQHQRRRSSRPRPSRRRPRSRASRVELPPAAVLPGAAGPEHLQPVDLKQTIRRDTLSAALAAAGADDIDVPAEWDGVTAARDIGRTVVARYLGPAGSGRRPDDVTILQTPPIRLEMPAGFPLDRFAEAVFRPAGSRGGRRERWARSTRRIRRGCWTCRTDGAVMVETMSSGGRDGDRHRGGRRTARRARRPCSSAARGASTR